MHSKNVASLVMIGLLTCSPVVTLAQSTSKTGSDRSSTSAAGADEQKAADAEKALKAKALSLLRQVVVDSSNLGLTENRIRVQLTAAELMWPLDEKQARELISAAAALLAQAISGLNFEDRNRPDGGLELMLLVQFRNEIVMTAARYDADLALELLQETKLGQVKLPGFSQGQDPDSQIEIALANQIAAKSPQRAYQVAEADLKNKVLSADLINVLDSLKQSKEPQYAAKLASDITAAIQQVDMGSDQQAANIAVGLLAQVTRTDSPDAGAGDTGGNQAAAKQPLLQNEDITALIEKITSYALGALGSEPQGTMEWNNAWAVLGNLVSNVPNLKQYDPQAATAVSQKLAAFPGLSDPNSQMWARLNQLVTGGTVQDILTAAEKEPKSVRANFYQQAIWKALNQGDIDQARQIMDQHITDPNLRDQTLNAISQNAASRDISDGKVQPALDLIAQIPGNEERASALVQLAESQAVRQGDRKSAMRILDQARALLPAQPQNYSQLQLLARLIGAYSAFDPKQSLTMISQVAGRLNSLVAAAQVLEGFDVQGNFKDGELLVQPRTQLTNMVQSYGEQLGELATKDFDSALAAVSLLDRADSRVFAELALVQRVLGQETEQEGIVNGSIGVDRPAAQVFLTAGLDGTLVMGDRRK